MTRSVNEEVQLFELGSDKHIPVAALRRTLTTVEMALFFGKVYDLDAYALGKLLDLLFDTTVIAAIMEGDHSMELQDYLVEFVPEDVVREKVVQKDPKDVPDSEVLAQLWKMAEVEVAKSIKTVADKLVGALSRLPSKEGQMVFQTMAQMNHRRSTIGVHKATIKHQVVPDVLVILDVSGSMTANTISAIIGDVVALSWKANAHLAIVSRHTFLWEPGSYDVECVLAKAEYGGTCYETLAPLFERDWGTVVTIADYDSSKGAKQAIARAATGRIGQVLDISLVNQPTFLAECVGQLADEVTPLLISRGVISGWY